MDSLKQSMDQMMEVFQTRMAAFEADLHKTSTPPTTIDSLTVEFNNFRTFIMQSLNSLQQQVEFLAHSVDSLEMQGRRKILLLHGVKEAAKEDTSKVVADMVRDTLKVSNFTVDLVRRSHRMGRLTSNKPRPILFKLVDVATRDKIWFAKKSFKGTGITVSEFLTKGRHDVFQAAREKYGVNRCWTKAGCVYVLGQDGTRHRVSSYAELSAIGPDAAPSASTNPGNTTTPSKTTRPKRAVTMKK